MSAENRHSDRISAHWRAMVLGAANQNVAARLHNFSNDGLSLILPVTYPVGTTLQIALAVPDQRDGSRVHTVRLSARVTYQVLNANGFQLGLQYTQINPDDLQRMKTAAKPRH